jgi:hypothetical protein
MYRGAGTGLIALGAVMAVVGGIMRFAVSVSGSGFSIHTIGDILLIAGIVLFVVGILALALGSSRRTTIREDVQPTPGGGQSRIEERDDRGAP